MPVTASAPSSPREFDLEPSDNARLANLCGPLDENLRLLESRLDVQIRRRGDNFRNLDDLKFSDFMPPDEFARAIQIVPKSNGG